MTKNRGLLGKNNSRTPCTPAGTMASANIALLNKEDRNEETVNLQPVVYWAWSCFSPPNRCNVALFSDHHTVLCSPLASKFHLPTSPISCHPPSILPSSHPPIPLSLTLLPAMLHIHKGNVHKIGSENATHNAQLVQADQHTSSSLYNTIGTHAYNTM